MCFGAMVLAPPAWRSQTPSPGHAHTKSSAEKRTTVVIAATIVSRNTALYNRDGGSLRPRKEATLTTSASAIHKKYSTMTSHSTDTSAAIVGATPFPSEHLRWQGLTQPQRSLQKLALPDHMQLDKSPLVLSAVAKLGLLAAKPNYVH